jgi:hypothetical protein
MNKWPAAYLLAALLSTPGVASAGIRCGSKLINPGDFSAYVLQQCGEPLSRQIISGSVGADSPVVEQWVYDFGRRQPLRVLTFSGGRLQRIEDAGRSR